MQRLRAEMMKASRALSTLSRESHGELPAATIEKARAIIVRLDQALFECLFERADRPPPKATLG